MNLKNIPVAPFAVVVAIPAVVLAQYRDYPAYAQYHHASTAGEGMARGMADVVRSAGEANLSNSAAARNYQEARSRDLDNRFKASHTYFEMRRANQQYREAERRPRPTQEDLIRYSKAQVPKRLGPNDIDPLTGQIAWPAMLKQGTYAEYRSKLDALFANRAKTSYLNAAQVVDIQQVASQMQAELKAHIREYPAGAYIGARKFIESLIYESQVAPA